MSRGLPPVVVRLVQAIVPRHLHGTVLSDLEEDYRLVRRDRRPGAAGWWLSREVVSLAWPFVARLAADVFQSGPRLARDARYGWRPIRRAPLAAIGAVATPAIGVLAVLLAWGLAHALLLRPVSVSHGETLRRIVTIDAAGRSGVRLSFLEVEQVRDHVAGRARVASANLQPAVLRVDGDDLQTMIEVVDGGYFDLIGTELVAGRALVAADDRAAASPVVVIGEALWRRRFAADPAVVGRTIHINRAAFTVVGVAARSSAASALGNGVDAWAPLAHGDAVLSPGWRVDPEARWFSLFALPSTSTAELDSELALAARVLAGRQPEWWGGRQLRSAPGTVLTGRQRDAAVALVAVLASLAALIVAAGAANLAGVLIAVASASERETAIHLALGSGRAAIARRMLAQGAVLGGASGALALAAYAWARRQVADVAVLPTLALRLDLPLDVPLGLCVVAASTIGGALLAAWPAWLATRMGTASVSAAAGQRAAGSPAISRVRRLLVAAQVGASLTLVVGAVLHGRSLTAMTREDIGFPRDGLVVLDFDLAPAVAPAAAAALAREALDRASALPGVTAVAMSSRAPIDRSLPRIDVRLDPGGGVVGDATMARATEDYFAAVGIPLLYGRGFSRAEGERDDAVVVVNEALALRLWGHADAVGRALTIGAERRQVRVVGVARDAKYRSITDAKGLHVYRPSPPSFNLALLVRTGDDPRRTLRAVQDVLDGVGPGVVGFFPRTMDDHLAADLLPARVAAGVARWLGLVGLLSSCVALYGLIAWLVERRRREIGVRLALGATPLVVVGLVVGQVVRAIAPGLAAGIAAALALGQAARTQLFGVEPFDPAAFALGGALVAVVVALAAWVPSVRASRIDPVTTLRDD